MLNRPKELRHIRRARERAEDRRDARFLKKRERKEITELLAEWATEVQYHMMMAPLREIQDSGQDWADRGSPVQAFQDY